MAKLDRPTRSHHEGSAGERAVGFLAASVFSVVYVFSPIFVVGTVLCLVCYPSWTWSWLCMAILVASALTPGSVIEAVGARVLMSWPMQQVLKFFQYEEFHEITDKEILSSGKNYIVGAHPHGVISFTGICAAVASAGAADGFGMQLNQLVPTAAASVIKVFPILKDVMGIFGVIDASSSTLTKRLSKPQGSFVLYIGGMIELFFCSPAGEVVFLKGRKGFIKLALRTGADVIPVYLFGNTTVMTPLIWGPLAALSRKFGVSLTVFWGACGLPVPRAVPLTYVRGRPLGLPHIENPTPEDIEKWHAVYCEKLEELFDRYKGTNPDYKNKTLVIQ